jgi:hypothetical protein
LSSGISPMVDMAARLDLSELLGPRFVVVVEGPCKRRLRLWLITAPAPLAPPSPTTPFSLPTETGLLEACEVSSMPIVELLACALSRPELASGVAVGIYEIIIVMMMMMKQTNGRGFKGMTAVVLVSRKKNSDQRQSKRKKEKDVSHKREMIVVLANIYPSYQEGCEKYPPAKRENRRN